MSAIVDHVPLADITINVAQNLDLVPNAVDFSTYPRFLERSFSEEHDRVTFFKTILQPVKSAYDYIFIDVPPTLSLQNDSAFYAVNQIVVVLQTQERAMTGAEQFVSYLQSVLVETHHSSVDILGVLPVLSKRRAPVDEAILTAAKDTFGEENVFSNAIHIQERIKRYDMTGITQNNHDTWDKQVHQSFEKLTDELLIRLMEAK